MHNLTLAAPWRQTYYAAKAGQEPAESLPSALRARLFRELLDGGMTMTEVAAWTRTTEYTIVRMTGLRTVI